MYTKYEKKFHPKVHHILAVDIKKYTRRRHWPVNYDVAYTKKEVEKYVFIFYFFEKQNLSYLRIFMGRERRGVNCFLEGICHQPGRQKSWRD